MRNSEINQHLAALAARNHGVVTAAQADAAGIAITALRNRAASGHLHHVDQDLFVVAGAPETWSQRALIACHSSGEHAVLSHRCAASLWELEGFASAPLEVTVPRWARRARRAAVVTHESTDLTGADRTIRAALPVTTVVRTLLDLGAVSHAHRIEQAMEDAFRRRLCTPEQVQGRYRELARPGKRGFATVRRLLDERVGDSALTHSELERLTARLIRSLPLPPPVQQHPVRLPDTTVRLDFAWPDRLIALECDGLYVHGTNQALAWDDRRQTELVLLGWHVVRASWQLITRQPEVITDQLLRAHQRWGEPETA